MEGTMRHHIPILVTIGLVISGCAVTTKIVHTNPKSVMVEHGRFNLPEANKIADEYCAKNNKSAVHIKTVAVHAEMNHSTFVCE